MLGGLLAVKQEADFECLLFDFFSFQKHVLAATEVDVSRRDLSDALVISQMIVVVHEVSDLPVIDH